MKDKYKDKYAVKLHSDGTIRVIPIAEGDEGRAKALACEEDALFNLEAEHLPLAEAFNIAFDEYARERGRGGNALVSSLCGFERTCIYGDAILQPIIREKNGAEEYPPMPYSVADTVAMVCRVYQHAMANGYVDTLRKGAADE